MASTIPRTRRRRSAAPQPCVVIRFNHFDPIWRRCWDRSFTSDGRRFVSYRAVEEAWLDDALASAEDGKSCFCVEASWVLRHYLLRHPGRAERFRALAREGRFELLGSGENILDTNIVHGELLIRNLVLGTLWAGETLGVRPTTGWCEDTFGTSAQLPQIYRGCGYRWIGFMNYLVPDRPYWRGLDGSAVFVYREDRENLALYMGAPGFGKHPPCPSCRGWGCAACDGRGFGEGVRADFAHAPPRRKPFPAGMVWLFGEEPLPGMHVEDDIARLAPGAPEFSFRQGTFRDVERFLAPHIARVDRPPARSAGRRVENNPVFTGCYVTRIRIKQAHRAAESELLEAETWDALLAGGRNAPELRECWRLMTLSGFHDAVTSSHCDPAYDELTDLLAGVRSRAAVAADDALSSALVPDTGAVTVFNAHPFDAVVPAEAILDGVHAAAAVTCGGETVPVYEIELRGGRTRVVFRAPVPAFGARTFAAAPAPAPPGTAPRTAAETGTRMNVGDFSAVAGPHGLSRVVHRRLGPILRTGRFLPAEPILETDYGDPWATQTTERRRIRLGPLSTLRSVEISESAATAVYEGTLPRGRDPMVSRLAWTQTFRFRDGIPWIEVETAVSWYTHSRRLRLAFPSTGAGGRGVYEIPCGALERDRYEHGDLPGEGAGGDWPALRWAGVRTAGHLFAVLNRGTPSHRVEDGVLLVSVLRSPQLPFGLLEARSYVVHNYDGMLDHGEHRFRHAICAAGDGVAGISRLAALFNGGVAARPGRLTDDFAPRLALDARHTTVAAVKAPERGEGVVVRLVEQEGRRETVKLRLPQGCANAARTDLLENPVAPLAVANGSVAVPVRPWEILTILIREKGEPE